MSRPRLAALALATLLLPGCGSDSKPDTADSTVAVTSAAPSTDPGTDSSVADTVADGEAPATLPADTVPADSVPADTAASVAGATDTALIFGVPRKVGEGLLEGWSPDGTALLVGRIDDKLSEAGCEGAPEPVLFVLPVDGGAPRVAFPGHTERNGSFIGIRKGTNELVTVAGCEGYRGDIVVSTQAPDGTLSNPRVVEVGDSANIAEQAGEASLSLDGSALLMTGNAFGDNEAKVVSTRIDLTTGASSPIETSGKGSAHIAEATDGRIVVSDGQAVHVAGPDGALLRSYTGSDFAVSPDGSRIAVISGDRLWIGPVAADLGDPVLLPRSTTSAALSFSPDGRAVGVLTYEDRGAVMAVRGGKVHVVAEGGSYGRLEWNPAGTAVAFNTFSADFSLEEAFVADALA